MQDPTIFIGLGGHGGKIVDKVAQQLKSRKDWAQLAGLNHFMIIDTDIKDLQNRTYVSDDNKVCISNFDKSQYQLLKFGTKYQQTDRKVTKWAPPPHEYRFRATAGAGAGQIRLESRLGMYYNLEVNQKIQNIINNFKNKSTSIDQVHLNTTKRIRFFICGSIAGGTGSGGFLNMSYLVQSMIGNGWTPNVTFILTLPTVFREKLSPTAYPGVAANGYAALKELEYLNQKMGYGNEPTMDFQFDASSNPVITTLPSARTYLVDRPNNISVDNIEQAIADTLFFLTYTPIQGTAESDLDNFEKSMKELIVGLATRYGVFGSHILMFPREDVIQYSVRRKLSEILKFNLAFSGKYIDDQGEQKNFSVNYEDPKFRRLSEDEQNKQIDDKFLQYIEAKVQEEKRDEFKGMFHDISGEPQKPDESTFVPKDLGPIVDKQSLWEKFFYETYQIYDKIVVKVELAIQNINEGDVKESTPTMTRSEQGLRENLARMKVEIRREAEVVCQNIRSGAFFRKFFSKYNVNPIAQRFFLIHLVNKDTFIPPTMNKDEKLRQSYEYKRDSDQDVKEWNNRLAKAVDQSLVDKLLDGENKKFKKLKKVIVEEFNTSYVTNARNILLAEFWQAVEKQLQEYARTMLTTFRQVARTADEKVRQEDDELKRFIANPRSVDSHAQTGQFEVYAETLRDDTNKKRLWDWFFVDKLGAVSFDAREINDQIIKGFEPVEKNGKLRNPDPNEIVAAIKENLRSYISDTFRSEINQMKLNVEQTLILESKYLLAQKSVNKPEEPDSKHINIFAPEFSRDERQDIMDRIPLPDLEDKITQKLKRIENECSYLATSDPSIMGSGQNVATQMLFSMDTSIVDNNKGDNQISLTELLKKVFGAENFTPGSGEPDKAIMFRSLYNIPIFNLSNVMELEHHYQLQFTKNKTKQAESNWVGYIPLHSDWRWETGVLPMSNLNPMEMKANLEKQERLKEVEMFVKGFYLEIFTVRETGVHVKYAKDVHEFAKDKVEAFSLLRHPSGGLWDNQFKDDYAKDVTAGWVNKTSERRHLPNVILRLNEYLKNTIAESLTAKKNRLDELHAYLVDEREVLENLINDLQIRAEHPGV